MEILSAILALLGLGTSIGGSVAQSQDQEKIAGKQQQFKDKTEAAQDEASMKAKRERRRKALSKAIGADNFIYEREVDAPKKPDLEFDPTANILGGVGTGISGLGSFLNTLSSTQTRADETNQQKQKKLEGQEDVDLLFPGSDITRLS